jgi:hypothetical protein
VAQVVVLVVSVVSVVVMMATFAIAVSALVRTEANAEKEGATDILFLFGTSLFFFFSLATLWASQSAGALAEPVRAHFQTMPLGVSLGQCCHRYHPLIPPSSTVSFSK